MPNTARLRRQAQLAHRTATVVALGGIAVFALLASQALPAVLFAPAGDTLDQPVGTVPLLLACALIILAWRRSAEARVLQSELDEGRLREHRLAYFDEVTGLHNRRYLTKEVFGRLGDERATLLLIDLDGFKLINDLYGHEAGDALLEVVGKRIADCIPGTADAVRLGGDEFAVCLTAEAADEAIATPLAVRIVAALGQPYPLADTVARIGASVGVATREDGCEALSAVLRRADIAMYEAKRLGRGRAVWFDAAMEHAREERARAEAEVRDGVTFGEFVPHFQPLLDLASLRIRGFEVLARWMHPRRGLLGPDDFLSVAEDSGLIAELSHRVMRAALVQAVQWPADLALAVNISPMQLRDPILADRILGLLRETGFPSCRLEVEVGEQVLLGDNRLALVTIEKLRLAGVRISLDDFGSGYAALGRAEDLPFDRIKIDRDFVAALRSGRQDGALVQAVAALGKQLSLPITAEGIESETIQDLLVTLGATDGQGWLYGAPLPGAEVARTWFGGSAAPKTPRSPPAQADGNLLPLVPDRRSARGARG